MTSWPASGTTSTMIRPSYALLAPHVRREGLVAGLRCVEATTDDARLVLRLIAEAGADGGARAQLYRRHSAPARG